MSDLVNIKCPSCKKKTKAERKSKYFEKMGCLMVIVHMSMVLLTASFWIGWLIGRWYFDGKINFCLKCGKDVDNVHII